MLSVHEVIIECERALSNSPSAAVPLAWMVRLWAAIGSEFRHEAPYRRNVLSFLTGVSLLPDWLTVRDQVKERLRELPVNLLRDCRDVLLRRLPADEIRPYRMQDDIEYGQSLYFDVGPPACAIPAAHAVVFAVRGRLDEVYGEAFLPIVWNETFFDECKEEDWDWEFWESATWAAIVRGGLRDTPWFDPQALRAFWLQWLRELVPFCLGDLNVVKQRVESCPL